MAEKTNIDSVIAIVRDQGYKYCCLLNPSQQAIVTYNRPSSDKQAVFKKLAEIKKRLEALPDGQYYVQCRNSFNVSVPGDMYPVVKGSVQISEAHPQSLNFHIPQNNNRDSNKVMSYQEALILTQENATLKAEVLFLKAENVRLQADLSAQKAQLSESPEVPSWQEWADNTLPSLLPVVDRLMALEEKKLALKEKEAYYKFGAKKKNTSQNQEMEIPKPGTEQFERWLDWIESLEEDQYTKILLYLNEKRPDIYEIVYDEFESEENEQQEQQQQENVEQK